ncbi:gamma-glutamyltransferase 1 Threonine peptidase. MEROPS family T03 [Noviherbaspirillum humi]|uniref:Glutathione hydrolase proenzyme n=1 Tax=Noviherbaspirillum humi TaxID=1688639 RepID=A0A239DZE6_9BURK|nr:gamma-glutamyltransferase [Noviherbaspirillum humi]SNS37072.1 gamma-glutamyltransferase 1 Threonine peptidase. MEROPS family T03 [Noviherbaspirillum humi]
MSPFRILPLTALLAVLAGCAAPPSLPTASEVTETLRPPEAATGYAEKPGWVARRFMIVAAHPLAADAGRQVLKAGGSAVDAAIAAQMVLTLVEPQSSGIGGGGFLLHHDGRKVQAFDGRETAPAAVDETLLQSGPGTPLRFHEAAVGGRAVGVPGLLRMLEQAHLQHGRLPWATLFAPAINLAEKGFPVSPRLARMLQIDPYLKQDAAAAAYFYDAAGKPWPAGHLLKNPALAATLREIALEGADAFYRGRIARDIEAKVRSHSRNPGKLAASDLAAYLPKTRDPVCSDYRRWTVCGMPPPSSGGIAVAQMLGMLERRNLASLPPADGVPAAEAVHLISEAGRLAYADRARYVADTDFVPLPGNSVEPLIDKRYLAERGQSIGERSMRMAPPGQPLGIKLAQGEDTSPELPSTSHISVVDAAGHAVAMTSSIEDAFGSRQLVRGFLLNNQLTDFSFLPADADGPVANRVQPGKRPRSAMAPTLVFDKATRKLVLAVGSPGGSSIINYVAKTLIGTLDWGLNMQQAISLQNFGSRNGPTELEQGMAPPSLVQALQARGHVIRLAPQTSGLHGIMRMNVHGEDMWFGGADPRREGVAAGE